METGKKKINKIRLYSCGYCVNQLSHVFRSYQKEIRKFPALSVLIEHDTYGNILYDTGYSPLIYQNGIVSKIYNTLNRTYVNENDTIITRLKYDNIDPGSINTIILSHAHPDHIAGLVYFQDYELISTAGVLNSLLTGNAFDLVFKNMVPRQGVNYRAVKPYSGSTIFDGYFKKVYDIFGDGSLIGIDLSGHADGQMGLWIPEYSLLLAADACWGKDLTKWVSKMRFIPKLIQDDYRKYAQCIRTLERFSRKHPEIKIIYSHGAAEEKTYEQ